MSSLFNKHPRKLLDVCVIDLETKLMLRRFNVGSTSQTVPRHRVIYLSDKDFSRFSNKLPAIYYPIPRNHYLSLRKSNPACVRRNHNTAVQSQKTVSAYFARDQVLPLDLQSSILVGDQCSLCLMKRLFCRVKNRDLSNSGAHPSLSIP